MLPVNIQRKFEKRESHYNLKGTDIFKKPKFRTKTMERTVSIKGINLWNELQKEVKQSGTIVAFKKIIKTTILKSYEEVEA